MRVDEEKMNSDDEEYSTPAFDKARMQYLRRTQQQQQQQQQPQRHARQSLEATGLSAALAEHSGGNVLDELLFSYHSLGFSVEALPLVFQDIVDDDSIAFDGEGGTVAALERLTDMLQGKSSDEHSPMLPLLFSERKCARDVPQAPFPWPIVDMAELEFGQDVAWMDTHAIAIVTGLPRSNEECVEHLRCLLMKLVQHIATVHDIWMPLNSELGLSKGFAFIRTDSHLGAWKVATALDGFPWLTLGTAEPSTLTFRQLQGRMFSAYGKASASSQQPSGASVSAVQLRRATASRERIADKSPLHTLRASFQHHITDNSDGANTSSSSSSHAIASDDEDDEIVQIAEAPDADQRTMDREQVDENDGDCELRNSSDSEIQGQSRSGSWESAPERGLKVASVDGMLPFLRQLSSERSAVQLNRTAPASTPIVLPQVHEHVHQSRNTPRPTAIEVAQAIRALNARLRRRRAVEAYSDELDTLDLHRDIAASNCDIHKLLAAEQAILQLHGLAVKNAAPMLASEVSSDAYFGLYQNTLAALQKLFGRGQPEYQQHDDRQKLLRKEQFQLVAGLFERLRSSILLNAVADVGEAHQQQRKKHAEEIQTVRSQLDTDYLRLRDQMQLARSLKEENDTFRHQLLQLNASHAREANRWEGRVCELQDALKACSEAVQQSRRQAEGNTSTQGVERLTKLLGAVPAYCARFERDSDFTDIEAVLETALAQVRAAKMEFAQRHARQEDDRNQQNLCVICIDNAKSVLLMPCRHLCVCEECATRAELSRCPVCRDRVVQTIKVFA